MTILTNEELKIAINNEQHKKHLENADMGHWYKANGVDICYTCSKCGVTNASGTKYNYCPHCGAKMEVKNNGESI